MTAASRRSGPSVGRGKRVRNVWRFAGVVSLSRRWNRRRRVVQEDRSVSLVPPEDPGRSGASGDDYRDAGFSLDDGDDVITVRSSVYDFQSRCRDDVGGANAKREEQERNKVQVIKAQ